MKNYSRTNKKYQKPKNKNKKDTHNRPYYGPWYDYYADAKESRKWAKALRHKLLFHIPLSEYEQRYVDSWGITENSQIDKNGHFKSEWRSGSNRWRFTDPKENSQKEIELGIRNIKKKEPVRKKL